MKHFYLAFATVSLMLCGCASQPEPKPRSTAERGGPATFTEASADEEPFIAGPGKPTIREENQTELQRAQWEWYTEVLRFRGVRMPKLLADLDSRDSRDWQFVRSKVVPPAARPKEWPPELVDAAERRVPLTREQQAYRDYMMWPKAIRERLQAKDWESADSRSWLVRQGRLYAMIFDFDTAAPLSRRELESDRWLQFADAMLGQGADGQQMLISNMIVRLGHDNQEVVQNAQSVLWRVGPDVIQPLLDVLWLFNAGNPNFNKNVVATLAIYESRAAGPAITELLEGPRGGVTWRSRRYFVELLGRLRDVRGVRAISEEIEKTDITEYRKDDSGKLVPDPEGTASAVFVFHEYCMDALGKIGSKEGLAPIIKLWEKDDDHRDGAVNAIFAITGQRVKTLGEAKALEERSRK
ncbi:MAG: hypothetical protein HUU03_10485 [Planctomycetaceae bacterium]|nr:hypothetical protein [Planctomycetaceae bacterium]